MTIKNELERSGVRDQHQDAPPQKSLLDFVSPTDFVELPSKGLFYPEGHPLQNKEVIEIKYMTAKEEDILTSETLLRKGLAIERFLESITNVEWFLKVSCLSDTRSENSLSLSLSLLKKSWKWMDH